MNVTKSRNGAAKHENSTAKRRTKGSNGRFAEVQELDYCTTTRCLQNQDIIKQHKQIIKQNQDILGRMTALEINLDRKIKEIIESLTTIKQELQR